MFLKLTDNETGSDVYLNPAHIVRFISNSAGEGTLIFLTADAGVAPPGEAQLLAVHENTEEVFRLISKYENPGKGGGGPGRGLI